MQQKTNKKLHSIRWLYASLKSFNWQICILTIGNILSAGLVVSVAYILRMFLNAAQQGQSKQAIEGGTLLLAVVVIQQLLDYALRAMTERLIARMENELQKKAFYKILMVDYLAIRKIHSGEIMTHLTGDVAIIVEGIITLIPGMATTLTRLIGAFALLVWMDPVYSIVFLGTGIIFLLGAGLFRKYIKKLHKNVQYQNGKLRSFMLDGLHGILLVKAYGVFSLMREKLLQRQKEYFDARMKRRNVQVATSCFVSAVIQAIYLITLLRGGFSLLKGTMQFGTLTAMLQLLSNLSAPLARTSGVVSRFYSVIASAERIMEMEQLSLDPKSSGEQLPTPPQEQFDHIEISGMSFAYQENVIFDNADFMLNRGDCVALVGLSGIGKSTLLQILLGVLRPEHGSVDWVGKNGEKIPMSETSYGLFGYVPQDKMLFSGTLREALTVLQPKALEEDIWKALRLACAEDFVKNLPNGLDTVLGEGGAGLSEGQLQRLSIARSYLSKVDILLLDEATSALDEPTEQMVLQNLKNIKDKTIVIISHRPAAKKICNRLFAVDNKQIVEINK